MSDWDLDSFSESLRRASERKETERLEWERTLPPPAVFVPDPEVEGHGFGLWPAEDGAGVVLIRKMSSGWRPETRQQFTREFVEALWRTLSS